VEMMEIYYEYSKKFPNFINFNFSTVFNASLVFGREKCMQFALTNSSDIKYYYNEEESWCFSINNIFEITDTVMYAIIGNNLTCLQTVFDMFMNNLKIDNWKHYFNFAASFSSPEIIQYMITLKPFLVDQIKNFYNNILQFALANANTENVKYALEHGAIYSPSMEQFVTDFNYGRPNTYEPVDEDYIDFYSSVYSKSFDFDNNYEECKRIIMNQ
jgi:hypothetical protein